MDRSISSEKAGHSHAVVTGGGFTEKSTGVDQRHRILCSGRVWLLTATAVKDCDALELLGTFFVSAQLIWS